MTGVDVLSSVLARSRASGSVFARSVLRAPWGLRLQASHGVQFHVVLDGVAWARGSTITEPLRLLPGDVLAVRGPAAYELVDDCSTTYTVAFEQSLRARKDGGGAEFVQAGAGVGAATLLLCGAWQFPTPSATSLLSELPTIMCITAASREYAEVAQTVRGLASELEAQRPGGQTALDRTLDLLLIGLLRAWMESGDAPRGWLGALRDPVAGRALTLMHERPDHPWSVESLAGEVGLSRAALARRFHAAVGETPIAYLTSHRMMLAAEALHDSHRSVAQIAAEVGYLSQFAFSTAFKRSHGVSPTVIRARLRERSAVGSAGA